MVYEYNSQVYLAELALNVKDLESQTAFYHQLLGLEILSQSGIRKERFSLLQKQFELLSFYSGFSRMKSSFVAYLLSLYPSVS